MEYLDVCTKNPHNHSFMFHFICDNDGPNINGNSKSNVNPKNWISWNLYRFVFTSIFHIVFLNSKSIPNNYPSFLNHLDTVLIVSFHSRMKYKGIVMLSKFSTFSFFLKIESCRNDSVPFRQVLFDKNTF